VIAPGVHASADGRDWVEIAVITQAFQMLLRRDRDYSTTYGYAVDREEALKAFAKAWRGE
jgi:hypothetical protein